MNRRQFIRWMLGGITTLALSGCASQETPRVRPSLATPSLTPTQVPSSRPTRPILRNENRLGFNVRYYKPFEAVDPDTWALIIEGSIKEPQKLSLAEIQSLPRITQVSRMKCVECWSAAAKWEGFHLRSLLQLVEPQPDAKWLRLYCADDYYESLTLEELMEERVLFAHRMDDGPLADDYGAPLRLIVPFKYGYKGPKAITRLVFAANELPGLWPTMGGYSTEGDILPGTDHPLDLEGPRRITGGEIRYPDGAESK